MQIRIATHDDQRMAVFQEAVKQFRKQYPDVTVLLELVPDQAAIVRLLASDNAPDIAEWGGANMGQLLDAGLLSDLSSRLYLIAWCESSGEVEYYCLERLEHIECTGEGYRKEID